MTADVAVITPSLPSRAPLLAEAVQSVAAQTFEPLAHLIALDYKRVGAPFVRNALARVVDADWLAFLDDDDLFLPHHLETLMAASTGADVVYSWSEVQGRDGWSCNEHFDAAALRRANTIPVTAMIRRSTFLKVGGFPLDMSGIEDWGLWLRALGAGARFVCVPEVTWIYRFQPDGATMLLEASR